jgi:hypothetical protein
MRTRNQIGRSGAEIDAWVPALVAVYLGDSILPPYTTSTRAS